MYQDFKIKPYGVNYDADPHDLDESVWNEVQNIRFESGKSSVIGGEDSVHTTFGPAGQAYFLLFNGDNATPIWIYCAQTSVRATDFTTDKNITGAALTSSTLWDGCLFNGYPVLNNAVDTPRWWDNDYTTPSTLQDVPGFPANTRCQAIRPYRSFLVALNIADTTATPVAQPNRLIWSNSSDAGALPADWDITDPSSLAGDKYLSDGEGVIMDGAQLRDYFIIYKTHSIYVMRLVNTTINGVPTVMRFDKSQVHIGLLSKNCVVEWKGKHFIAGDGDFYLFDGQNAVSIGNDRIRKKVFDNISNTYLDLCHVSRYDSKKEIWFLYPEDGQTSCNKAAIWNWQDDTWSVKDLIGTYHTSPGVVDTATTFPFYGLAGIVGGDIVEFDNTFTDKSGFTKNIALVKESMDFGHPDKMKMVKSVLPRITGKDNTAVTIEIGTQNDPDEAITWSAGKTYSINVTAAFYKREIFFNVRGRYISIRITSNTNDAFFDCHGVTFKYKLNGNF